jgi:predicted GTPase
LLRSRREKGKKGEERRGKINAVPKQQNWRKKMKRKKTKRKQQGCDVAKVIDTVEQAVSTAKKVYRAIEPVVNAITNRRKTK